MSFGFSRKSPLQVLIFITLLIIISFNFIIFNKSNHQLSKIDVSDSGAALDPVKTNIYEDNLTKDIIDKYKLDLYHDLKSSLHEVKFEQLLKDLKNKLNIESNDSLIEELKKDVLSEKENEFIQEFRNSLSVAEKEKLIQLLEKNLANNLKGNSGSHVNEKDTQKTRQEYFKNIFENLLLKNGPKLGPLTAKEKGTDVGGNFFYQIHRQFTIHFLKEGRVNLSPEKFNDLQSNHDNLVKEINQLEFPSHIFSGNGIVINGGGVYFGAALVAIRNLRELGSTLPIELIIDTFEEYDEQICEDVLPILNTKCLVLEKELGKELHKKLNLQKFELKIMGLFVSSFENIFLLDADNFAIKNPDYLLTSKLYNDTSFLLWPDIWHRGTSPLYYDIARINIGEPVRRDQLNNDEPMRHRSDMALHDLQGVPPSKTVESGQMAFSKKNHYRSFLLSVYYNMYGYSHYYRLFFQGTNGEGDKETFLPALHVFNEPYHLNDYLSWLAGYDEGNKFQETTIVQYDPIMADEFLSKMRYWLQTKGIDSRISLFQDNAYTKNLFQQWLIEKPSTLNEPDVQFLHFHRPKINPLKNFDDEYETYKRRNLGPVGKHSDRWSNDWELRAHAISKWVACDAITSESFWKKMGLSQKKVCSEVSQYVEFLKKDTNDPDMAILKDLGV